MLACELIEHLARDPMHFVLECRRILEDGGRLIVTTPNAASLTSVARVLHGYNNPQISSVYHRPRADAPDEAPHVREYTAFELGRTLEAGGFEIESLFTEPIGEFEMNRPMWNFLEENGYNNSLRGEQTYCVAVKRGDGVVERYPQFLYSPESWQPLAGISSELPYLWENGKHEDHGGDTRTHCSEKPRLPLRKGACLSKDLLTDAVREHLRRSAEEPPASPPLQLGWRIRRASPAAQGNEADQPDFTTGVRAD